MKPLRVILIDHSEHDEELVLHALRSGGYAVHHERVQTGAQLVQALRNDPNRDVILSDYSLPQFSAPLALTLLKQTGLNIPFIIVSGTVGEERAVLSMRQGARDFILKSDLSRLIPVIEREIREAETQRLKRKVERAYRSSEQRYRMIIDTAREGIWLFDSAGKAIFANRYLAEMLHYHEQDILNLEFQDFAPLDSKAEAHAFFQRRRLGGNEQTDFQLQRSDGQTIDVLVSATSMMDPVKGFQGYLAMLTDVTDRKKIEMERTQLLEELQTAVRVRDEFLSIASHELKTPLTTLKLQTQLRRRAVLRDDLSGFTRERLKTMFEGDNRQIDRLARLIDDMLDISRINTGKLVADREFFDLPQLLRDVIERHHELTELAGCSVTLDLCHHVVGHWDKFRMEQVVTNLLTNALKYGSGQPVEVKLECPSETRVQFSVTDRGIGIAPENHERIFQRFERAISANDISGLGLGLYIVKQIVEMHGGQVRVESALGTGSTFTVELPLDTDLSVQEWPDDSASQSGLIRQAHPF